MWDLSSPTRNQTHTPCVGRQSLNHCATREAPSLSLRLAFSLISALQVTFHIRFYYFNEAVGSVKSVVSVLALPFISPLLYAGVFLISRFSLSSRGT